MLFVTIKSYCSECDSIPLTINISLLKEYYVPYTKPIHYVPVNDSLKQKIFDIKISLKNTSKDSIRFWMMTCSWDENFLINNNYIYFSPKECDSNFPHTLRIKSGDSVLLYATLKRDIQVDNPCQNCVEHLWVSTTKLGLIYIDKNQCDNMLEYDSIINDKSIWSQIIWSNSVYLDK